MNHAFTPVKPLLSLWEQASTVQNLSFGIAEEASTVQNLSFGTTEEASTVQNLSSTNANLLSHRVESWLQATNEGTHLGREASDRSDASFLYQALWLPITILMFQRQWLPPTRQYALKQDKSDASPQPLP